MNETNENFIMDLVSPAKIPRKREPNFTADEKAFLAQLVKKRPIVESKQTDGKVIEKKKAAWESITIEFNSNLHVNKRDTLTLKRAWDNMKALTRKVRAAERGSLIRTGGGPSMPPTSPLVTIVEEAAPVIICEIDNNFDSDGVKLHQDSVQPSQEFNASIEWENTLEETSTIPDQEDTPPIVSETNIETRKPIDYVRREAVMRIKHFDNKKKIEMQILKSKLEVQEIKKRTAILLEEKARMELEEIQIRLGKH